MELFFDDNSALRYWASGPAAVTQLSCTPSWPPTITAAGYAPCIRAWSPVPSHGKSKQQDVEAVEFAPAQQLCEFDTHAFTACAIHGNVLAGATSESSGKIIVWNIGSWERAGVLQLNAAVASLALNAQYIAAGTATGQVHVWHCSSKDGVGEWLPLFQAPLQLDTLPICNLALTTAPDGEPLLVVHSSGHNAIGVWRLVNGKLVHRMQMKTTGDDAVAVTAANMRFMLCEGPILAAVSHRDGHDPVIQLVHVLTKEGDILDAPDRLHTRSAPLAADFDGALLAVGFADGAVATFGYRGWLRWHHGAVGAVHVLRGRMQVLSACAAGEVRLWDAEGCLLASLQPGFQVTSLAGGDVFAVAGGNQGQLQIIVLNTPHNADKDQAQDGGIQGSDSAGNVKQLLNDSGSTATQPSSQIQQYKLSYDLRGMQLPAGMAHPTSLTGVTTSLLADENLQSCFGVPPTPVSEDHFKQQQEQSKPSSSRDSEAVTAGTGSGFDVKAALKGAQTTKEEEARLADAAKKQQLQQMGEGAGVARMGAKVLLASSVEHLGRKCDNPSCLAREGTTASGKFSRCGGCKKVWYCSAHCQRTHWRDGHNKQCKEWQQQKANNDRHACNTKSQTQQQQQQQEAKPATQGISSSNIEQNDQANITSSKQQKDVPVICGKDDAKRADAEQGSMPSKANMEEKTKHSKEQQHGVENDLIAALHDTSRVPGSSNSTVAKTLAGLNLPDNLYDLG